MIELFFKTERALTRLRQGPLSPYMNLFAQQLADEGYRDAPARAQIGMIAEFSVWLKQHRVSIEQITPKHTERSLRCTAKRRLLHSTDPSALNRMLAILRQQGVIPTEAVVVLQPSPAELLRDQFVKYLLEERGLAQSTAFIYQKFVLDFLNGRFSEKDVSLTELNSIDIVSFVRQQARILRPKRAKLMTSALRSFFRFAHYRGLVVVDLTESVPKVLSWSMTEIPKALPASNVARALAACNRQNSRGRRDYAILLLLSRLGLRAGEVALLTLDDIDWDAGTITIRGKGNQQCKLPLPTDVGEAIANYLHNGRPQTKSRAVFFTVKAPIVAFTRQETVGHIVARVLNRAGIETPHKGAHQFRHCLAVEMLSQGSTLGEIGEILRHNSPQSTMIYAKVDLVSLRQLALPWPGCVR